MQKYLNYLLEYQCSVIKIKANKKGGSNKIKDNILNVELRKTKVPTKKHSLKTTASKQPKKLNININETNNSISKLNKKNEKNESDNDKKDNKNEKKPAYADKLKDEYSIDMEEYLKTDVEDMKFEDALKYDGRTFCKYFCDKCKENQIIMDTFFNPEELKPKTIKILILFLNVILCK